MFLLLLLRRVLHCDACLFWWAAFLLLCILSAGASRGHMGTYDWAMRSTTDTSPWRPSFWHVHVHCPPPPPLSSPPSSSPQHGNTHRVKCPMFSCISGFIFRSGDCETGAHVATRTKLTFLLSHPQQSFRDDITCYHPLVHTMSGTLA